MTHMALTDEAFEDQFRDGILVPAIFNHEAHLRLAWIHLRRYGPEQALRHITTQLKNFTRLVGEESKYNETLTRAAVLMVYHFMRKAEIHDFEEFIRTYPRLKTHFKELIGQHYTTNIFQSEQAKREWMAPELAPFDL